MKISVITATYNAINDLPRLVESLRNQEDQGFEWVVADGASTDGTLDLLQSITDLNIKVSSQEDFGIYDALNRAIKISSGEFYLVVGADDFLYPSAIKDYKQAIEEGVDIVTSPIQFKDRISPPEGRGPSWLYAQFAYISGHAVGSIYRKSLHQEFGLYSRKFPIAADQFFILKCIKGGAKIKRIKNIAGYFNDVGVSSIDLTGALTEWYRVQLMVGEKKFSQTLLFFMRLIKHYKKLK